MDSSSPPEPNSGRFPGNTPGPAQPVLRASDADRERAAAVLKDAMADGRVTSEELENRLGFVYRAKSRVELESLVADLQPMQWAGSSPTVLKDVGVINSLVRKGRWVVGAKYRATAVISTGVIDLREAQFIAAETTIRVSSWISTVYVVVPENAEVRVGGVGVLGGFELDRAETSYPTTHLINVTGMAVCGTVLVVHRLPPDQEHRLRK